MKSAYELAMERFGGDDDKKPLTDEQKERLAEIDKETQAKIAEIEIMHQQKIADAAASGDFGKIAELEEGLKVQKEKAREQGEFKKDQVRNS